MNPVNLCQIEVLSDLSKPVTAFLRIGLAFILGSPFVFSAMPGRVKAVGLTVLLLFVGFFGAAVGQARAGAEGRSTRLRLLPLPKWLVFLDQIWADSVVDFLQTGPILALLLAIGGKGVSLEGIISLAALFVLSLLMLNILGVTLGRLVAGNREIHLAGGLAVGLLAFLSGLFPVPERIEWLVAATARYSPMAHLARELEALVTGAAGRPALEASMGTGLLAGYFLVLFVRLTGWSWSGRSVGSRPESRPGD